MALRWAIPGPLAKHLDLDSVSQDMMKRYGAMVGINVER